MENLIIGAGPAGIGTALSLDKDATILEAGVDFGGLSSSIEIDSAIFDLGGHSFHTPHPEVKDLVYNSLDMYEQTRNAKCFSHGQVIPYPFQKNFRLLNDPQVVAECSQGLPQGANAEDFDNFEDFIVRKFGTGISKHFMLPYNRKLWGRDLKRMAADWTGERVAAPEGVNEKFETSGGKRKPLQADTKVGYPAKGGFGEIFKTLGRKVKHIKFDHRVDQIDFRRQRVYTNGNPIQYQSLISTMPIPNLLRLIDGTPQRLIGLADQLDYLSMKLGLVVVNHPVDTDIQRFYSADEDIAAHKIAINHNSSDYLRGLPHHGIMMEISTGPEKILYRQDMEQWIVDSLLKVGAVKSAGEIAHVEVRDVKYSYPVPTKERDALVQEIKNWLEENKIYTVGRFGEWAYINSDKSLYRGLELGRKVAGL